MARGERVVIGMDPHKRSVTIEVMTVDEAVVGGGRFGTDVAGNKDLSAAQAKALLAPVRAHDLVGKRGWHGVSPLPALTRRAAGGSGGSSGQHRTGRAAGWPYSAAAMPQPARGRERKRKRRASSASAVFGSGH
ncbi:MAG: hypothetical protein ACRDP9_27230 [Kribbellaceae bacterium]